VDQVLVVAAHVAFERQTLKPGYHLIGSGVETGRFQAMGQLLSNVETRTALHRLKG
jgi:hypothetical protein